MQRSNPFSRIDDASFKVGKNFAARCQNDGSAGLGHDLAAQARWHEVLLRDAAGGKFADDLAGFQLGDSVMVRHIFTSLVMPTGSAVVVFGGGTPLLFPSWVVVQTASTGALGLDNGGDLLLLPGHRTMQAGTMAAAALGTFLLVDRERPFCQPGRLRRPWTADQPFVLGLEFFLLLPFLRLLGPPGNLGYRTDQLAETATGAFVDIDIACMLGNPGGKVARFPLQRSDITVGEQFDIAMAPDLDLSLWPRFAHLDGR